MKLTNEQKEDDLVKSLLASDFTEETIAGWIADGAITLEKSTQYGPDDHGEGAGDDVHEKRDRKQEEEEKKEKKEIEDKDKDVDEDLEKGKGCGDDKGDKKDMLAKSLGLDEFYKSMESAILEKVGAQNNDIAKSLPGIVEDCMVPFVDRIEKSLDGMRQAITAFGNSAPSFKTAGLSKAVIEKSIEMGGGAKDENDKLALSITRDRDVVKAIIMKSIDEEKDETLQKSLRDNSTTWILDPIGGLIGEPVAQYLYNNKNVRLVK